MNANPSPTTAAVDTFDYESALEACARGERFALRALYERESSRLLGVALRIVRDRDLAQDVLHEAFLQVWQRSGTYERALGSARGWLYTVVRHRALDELRRRGRETAVGDDLEVLSDLHTMKDAAGATPPADTAALERCMAALDEYKRTCILHAFVDGYTHEEIARRLATRRGAGRQSESDPCHQSCMHGVCVLSPGVTAGLVRIVATRCAGLDGCDAREMNLHETRLTAPFVAYADVGGTERQQPSWVASRRPTPRLGGRSPPDRRPSLDAERALLDGQ